jgi:hypothetical protein
MDSDDVSIETNASPSDRDLKTKYETHQQVHDMKNDEKSGKISEGLKFFLTWGMGVIGVAAAIVFGIWAPLSYKVTVEANQNGDNGQNSMMRAMSDAQAQATSVLNVQASMLAAQTSANSRLEALGQIFLLDFCWSRTVCIFSPSIE